MRRSPIHPTLPALLLAAVAACTRADPPAQPGGRDAPSTGTGGTAMGWKSVEAWSLEIDPYVSDSQWSASTVENGVMLLHTRDGLLAIDTAAGTVRWTGTGSSFVHPRGRSRPLYRMPDLTKPFTELAELIEIDASDGSEMRRTPIAEPLRAINLRVVVGTDVVVARVRNKGVEEFVAIDAATGKTRWRAPAVGENTHPIAFLADRFIVQSPYQAYALADGATMWARDGDCCDLFTSSDGAHTYVRATEDTFAELDHKGADVRVVHGELVAGTGTHVAVDTGTSLQVVAHGAAQPLLEIPYQPGLVHTSVTLSTDAVFYFDQDADTVYRHGFDGERTEIVKLTKRLAISTERSDVLEPSLGFPPLVDGDRVYLMPWTAVRAFDLTRPKSN